MAPRGPSLLRSLHVRAGVFLGCSLVVVGALLAAALAGARQRGALGAGTVLALGAAAAAALVALNGFFLSRRVLGPVQALLGRFDAAGSVVPDAGAPGARPVRDEIDLLHSRFDAMRDEANESINRLAMQLEEKNLSLEKAVKNISALNRVGVALSSELDIDRLTQLLVNISVKGLRVEVGTIQLLDERTGRLVVRASCGLPGAIDPELAVVPGGSVSGTVAGDGKPLLIRRVDGTSGVKVLSRLGYTRRSVLCVPIKIKERVLGTIELTNRRGEESFSFEDLEMLQSIANQAAVAIENANLYRDVQRSYLETVLALVQAVEEKDRYTRGHSERVTAFSVKIAQSLGLDPRQVRMIEYAGVLHDIGKLGIDQAIIQKNGRLTPEEYTVIKNHPLIGERIVRPIGFLADALPAIAQHHERVDGKGYPRGLEGERMALEARILSVADAYDAMITERPYRKPLAREAAVAELVRCSGSQFDPTVVEHFIELLHNDPEVQRLEMEASTVGT
jgi:putative nucleotidyltransferase with HDIG domain